MKAAKDIETGDKLVSANGDEIVVESVRIVVESNDASESRKIKYITAAGQPEIADWNLQKYIDQGAITIG